MKQEKNIPYEFHTRSVDDILQEGNKFKPGKAMFFIILAVLGLIAVGIIIGLNY